MRDPGWRPARWRSLGRLLPEDVRERVFEPAFGDLLRAWVTATDRRRRLPFALQAWGTFMGCFPIAIPRLFVRDGRLTRFSRVSLWAAGILATVALIVTNVAESYGS